MTLALHQLRKLTIHLRNLAGPAGRAAVARRGAARRLQGRAAGRRGRHPPRSRMRWQRQQLHARVFTYTSLAANASAAHCSRPRLRLAGGGTASSGEDRGGSAAESGASAGASTPPGASMAKAAARWCGGVRHSSARRGAEQQCRARANKPYAARILRRSPTTARAGRLGGGWVVGRRAEGAGGWVRGGSP